VPVVKKIDYSCNRASATEPASLTVLWRLDMAANLPLSTVRSTTHLDLIDMREVAPIE